jgi:protein subunit release factor B
MDLLEQRLARLGIRPEDLEEQFIRGSGPGGQKINKTSSTVRLLHRPSGLEVRCGRERSLAQNRRLALEDLCRKLEKKRQAARALVIHQREKARRQRRGRSRSGQQQVLQAKKRRSQTKSTRSQPRSWDD